VTTGIARCGDNISLYEALSTLLKLPQNVCACQVSGNEINRNVYYPDGWHSMRPCQQMQDCGNLLVSFIAHFM